MSEQSRRAFLAAGAGGLAALAGCSGLPFVGGGSSSVEYDAERLQAAAEPEAVASAPDYPGPVPASLAEAHYDRAEFFVSSVPESPSFRNGAVQRRLRDEREQAAASLSPPEGDGTMDELDGQRYDRGHAAEVWGAYRAASGAGTEDAFRERRDEVRRVISDFRADWSYRGASAVEAFAVHRHLEEFVGAAERYLVGEAAYPERPKSAVFELGELVGDRERAHAYISDASGLRDAYVTDDMTGYWGALGTAGTSLRRVVHATQRRVDPYLDEDADPGDFSRDISDTPAARLFFDVQYEARSGRDGAEAALDRTDYASAVGSAGRALVGTLALKSVVDAIRDGEYGMPPSADAVLDHRQRALSAIEDALAVEPAPVTEVLAARARGALREAEQQLGGGPEYEGEDADGPDRYDIEHAVAAYGVATHVADAVAPVADRVVAEIEDAA